MTTVLAFNPRKHKGRQLYTPVRRAQEDGSVASVLRPVDVPHKIAKKTPWYYYVIEGEDGAPDSAGD